MCVEQMGVKVGRTRVECCCGLASMLHMRPHLQTPLTEKETEMRAHCLRPITSPCHCACPHLGICHSLREGCLSAHKHHGVKAPEAMTDAGLEDEHPSVFSLPVGNSAASSTPSLRAACWVGLGALVSAPFLPCLSSPHPPLGSWGHFLKVLS